VRGGVSGSNISEIQSPIVSFVQLHNFPYQLEWRYLEENAMEI
jgi:hypothetical protein